MAQPLVTPTTTKWIIGATAGAAVLMLADLVLSMFHVNTGLRDGSPLAIGFSLLVIGIAAFNFLLDFDQADRAIAGSIACASASPLSQKARVVTSGAPYCEGASIRPCSRNIAFWVAL